MALVSDQMGGINDLELAKIAQTICISNQEKLDKMECIRNVIDYQFQRTSNLQYFNLFIFLFLYVVPFTIQLFLDLYEENQELHVLVVQVCNFSLLGTATYFELIELVQFFDNKSTMNIEKVKKTRGGCNKLKVSIQYAISLVNMEYLVDFNNIIEQVMFILNCYYNHSRLNYP